MTAFPRPFTLIGAPYGGTGYFGDGSAAAPSLAFASAPTTGLYLASGQIRFAFGAADGLGVYLSGGLNLEYLVSGAKILLNSSGAIGITASGTNQNITLTPSGTGAAALTLNEAIPSGSVQALTLQNSGATRLMTLGVATNYSWIQSLASKPLALNVLGNSVLLGTGTDSGNGILQLATHTTAAGGIGFGTDTPLYRTAAGKLALQNTASTLASLRLYNSVAGSGFSIELSSASAYLWNYENGPLFLGTNATNALTITTGQSVTATSPTGGLGYGTGAGGTVTQITSRATGVTLNKVSGAITLFNAAGSATAATFTVTNSAVAATDTVQLSVKSGTNVYIAVVSAVAAGSFNITFWTTGGTAADSPVINFAVIKAVTA